MPLNCTTKRQVEPRAGFDPAACCLRGSRSAGLSYRGPNASCVFEGFRKFLNVGLCGLVFFRVFVYLAVLLFVAWIGRLVCLAQILASVILFV